MKDARQQENSKSMGQGMIVVAMVIGLGLLTYTFQDAINKQHNPNQNVQSSRAADNQIEVILRQNRSGHYVTTGAINGQKAVFLLDTGATYVAIPERQANRLGLKKGRIIPISTANGRSNGHKTHINELSIGQIRLYNVKAIITPNLEEILLGMSVLKQLEFTQRGKELTIRQRL
ncbi:MAG: TIGR02281 family clan AA aspartic protease [Gammaproteobacteria bacterium]|nr:TIGR02281 family clan AA aspartic protease [Gammaproteobacteria bacterium]